MSDSSDSVRTVGSRKDDNITKRVTKKVRVSNEHLDTSSDIRKLKIRAPPFSPEDPELWFALIESQFDGNGITDDFVKFNNVTNNLDIQYAKAVKDIIVNPPAKNRYEKLKAELIKRLSASHEKKVVQLLTHEELGDRKPSQFLRHLQDLAGPSVPEDFLRTIWSNRLPHNIQTVLASQPTHSMEQLADLADRIQELTSPYNAAVAATSTSTSRGNSSLSEIAELKKMVEQLTLKLEEHTRSSCCSTSHDRSRPRGRRPSERDGSRQRSRSNSSYQKYPTCWYHSRFGAAAKRCFKPCNFNKAGNSTGNR